MRTEPSAAEKPPTMESPTSPLDDGPISNTDASRFLIKDLKQIQGTALFDKLDFTNCQESHIERLFAPPPDSYLPPPQYRRSAGTIMEWINLSAEEQEKQFELLNHKPTAKVKRAAARRTSATKKGNDPEDEEDDEDEGVSRNGDAKEAAAAKEKRKIIHKKADKSDKAEQPVRKKPRKPKKPLHHLSDMEQQANALTGNELAAQELANDLLRSEQYSANGSILFSDDEDSVMDGEEAHLYKGQSIALDPKSMQQAARLFVMNAGARERELDSESDEEKADTNSAAPADRQNNTALRSTRSSRGTNKGVNGGSHRLSIDSLNDEEELYNGASIFGQTQGQNAVWVECDRCKKWRRLRGKVDASKLPAKWFCSMNKTDPTRSKCSAPEENYDENHAVTPESAADARARKHLRVWVRRIKTQEAYEAGQPPMTRGKKRQVAGSKDPYEWVRCCNPSCGKWRALLRVMAAKSHVIDQATKGEWYCVMNTWDEKVASCGAPQENLPAFGCPSWVQQDGNQAA